MPRISYLSKPNNLPDIGWVEYLSQYHSIFWIKGVSKDLYRSLHQQSLQNSKKHFHTRDFRSLGLLKNLIDYRLEQEFALPIFTSYTNRRIHVTCGMNRFFALSVCQVAPEDIKFFLQADKNFKPVGSLDYQLITSTHQAENLSNMGAVDHVLSMMPEHPYYITSSVIRGSIYNKNYNEQYIFSDNGRSAIDFWEEFISDGLINIDVHCDETVLPLLQYDPNIWRINYHVGQMNTFSYSDILHKFQLQEDNKLHLNLYNITQPIVFEYMIPLVSKNNSWYYTQNKKIHLYKTTQTKFEVLQPTITWPNFAK